MLKDMYNPFSLSGKRILVTGASSGIGRAVAIECSKMGAAVILTARNEERLQETLQQLEGDSHRYIAADLTNADALKQLAEAAGEVDGVVFAAGVSALKPIQAVTEKDIESIFATNYTAAVMLTKVLAKQKRITKQGSLVYIASISGNGNTATGLSTYGSSKAALSAFVKYAAVELSGKQIRCNTISPGRIETAFLQNGTMNAEDIQRDMERYPLRRYGRAEEVAQAAVYLLSDATQWVTGTELKIDGGRTLV